MDWILRNRNNFGNSNYSQEFTVLMNVFSIWLFHHIILDNIYIMQIYKDLPTTHKDNTQVICVTIDSNEENTDIYGTIAFQANFQLLI